MILGYPIDLLPSWFPGMEGTWIENLVLLGRLFNTMNLGKTRCPRALGRVEQLNQAWCDAYDVGHFLRSVPKDYWLWQDDRIGQH